MSMSSVAVSFPSSASGKENVSISCDGKGTAASVQPNTINTVGSIMGFFPECATRTTIGSPKPVLTSVTYCTTSERDFIHHVIYF